MQKRNRATQASSAGALRISSPSRARALGAAVVTTILLAIVPAHAGDVMVAWSQNGATTPYYSVWDYATETWGAATAMSDVGKEPDWVVMKSCPTRDEKICVTQDQDKDVNVQIYDGCTWGAVTEVCDDVDTIVFRAADVAYEQLSGNALVLYWDKGDSDMGYVTWDGSSLSAETTFAEPDANKVRWVSLYPRPGTDDIIAIARNDNKKTQAIVWDGTAWEAGWTELGSTAKKKEFESYSLAFESLSGHALVVYDEDATTPRYQTWDGTSWSGESDLPDIGKKAWWIQMAADPLSDEIICGAIDEDHDINVIVWDGSSWGATLEIEDDSDPREERSFDVAYEQGGNEALVVYFEKGTDELRYRTWNGAAWSAEVVGTDLLDNKTHFIELETSCCRPGEIFIAASDGGGEIDLLRWDGTAMTAKTEIETDWGSAETNQQFMIAVPELPFIVSWTELSP